jgi:hypothetical protein
MAYKVFAAGEEALASDVNSFLMSQTVPRFASAAQRASQLAAPANGQLSTLDSRLGTLQYWTGSAWADAVPFMESGFSNVATNASGDILLTYPIAFAQAPILVLTALTTGGGAGSVPVTLSVWGDGSGASSATVRAARGATILASTQCPFYWLAMGTRPAPA